MVSISILQSHQTIILNELGKRHLIIADAHIGFEERLIASGVSIPASIEEMSVRIERIILRENPDELLILGDLKYSIRKISRSEWRDVPLFLERVNKLVPTRIILGNHDGNLVRLIPDRIQMVDKPFLLIGRTCLMHGHTNVPVNAKECNNLIIGHVHPIYSRKGSPMTGNQVLLVLKVEKKDIWEETEGLINIYVIPSFNKDLTYSGFSTRSGRIISPILRKIKKKIIDARIFTVDGDMIGGLESIEQVLNEDI